MKFNPEEVSILRDLQRGRHDIVFFAEEILGLTLNPSQKRWFRLMGTRDDGWSWKLIYIIHVAANQIGKTLGLAIIVLWACSYKIGVPFENEKSWYNAPYQWFHVAPTQNQAYLLLADIRLIIKGVHPAQDKFGKKLRLPAGLVAEDKHEGYYDGLTFWNGALCQFRTTEDKAKALLGRRAAGISFDECAFDIHLTATVDESLLLRLASTGGPLILVSTPNGMNEFYEIVTKVRDRATPIDKNLWFNEDYREGLVWSTIEDNVGFGLGREEVDRMYSALEGVTTAAQQLEGAFVAPDEAYFVPQNKIEKAFRTNLPNMQRPKPGHKYAIFWDPSDTTDPTAVVVLDVTTYPWVGVFNLSQAPRGADAMIPMMIGLHHAYNSAYDKWGRVKHSEATTGYDATSMGGAMIRRSLVNLKPQRAINFGGSSKVKRDMLSNVRAAMLEGKLILPASWIRLKREVLNYRLPDDKLEQDNVVALAGAASIAGSPSGSRGPVKFSPHSRVRNVRRL